MYEAKPLLDEYQKNLEAGGPYWKWAPNVCRMSFLTDTIRIEVDTSEETGAKDWNYIDAVEIHGSTSIQAGALRQKSNIGATGGRVTSNVKVVYVPTTLTVMIISSTRPMTALATLFASASLDSSQSPSAVSMTRRCSLLML